MIPLRITETTNKASENAEELQGEVEIIDSHINVRTSIAHKSSKNFANSAQTVDIISSSHLRQGRVLRENVNIRTKITVIKIRINPKL